MKYTNKIQLSYWLWVKGWTSTDLHEKSKINSKTISIVKNKGKANFETMERLAEVFEITIPQLFIIPDEQQIYK
jgi:DNA-binding Xre family transcriptional regulator